MKISLWKLKQILKKFIKGGGTHYLMRIANELNRYYRVSNLLSLVRQVLNFIADQLVLKYETKWFYIQNVLPYIMNAMQPHPHTILLLLLLLLLLLPGKPSK